jgi:hypothetical protein
MYKLFRARPGSGDRNPQRCWRRFCGVMQGGAMHCLLLQS